MDSFYDAPRRAPIPIQFEDFLATPAVSEVSMIGPSKQQESNILSYNLWKNQHKHSNNTISPNLDQSSDAFAATTSINTSQSMKKQVRFESPKIQPKISKCEPIIKIAEPKAPPPVQDLIYKARMINVPFQKHSNNMDFKQIYMANIPKRELDLSVIDLPRQRENKNQVQNLITENAQESTSPKIHINEQNKENIEVREDILPQTYREFLEKQSKSPKDVDKHGNDSVTDIFNYKRHQPQTDNRVRFHENNRVQSPSNYRPHSPDINYQRVPYADMTCTKQAMLSPPKRGDETKDYLANRCNVIDKHNYYGNESAYKKCDVITQTSSSCLQNLNKNEANICNTDPELLNKDLLKIIAQQNEQLLLLQKQVAMLLQRDHQSQNNKAVEATPAYHAEKLVSSTQNEQFLQEGTPKKRGMSKFSIDLMTSFEVAIRPQHNKPSYVNMAPKIQEITESESTALEQEEKVVEQSLHLQEPVREICPSPEPSINIKMQDYDSSEDEATVSEIGATFYRNLMGQVNHILKRAHVQTQDDLAAKAKDIPPVEKKTKTMNRVKEATLKHLKSIGVTIGPMTDSDDSECSGNESKDYSPTEISFAVKQLLMKYLPDEQLAKIQRTEALAIDRNPGIIPPRPEFSFASVQYMKKYNLLPTDGNVRVPRQDLHCDKGQADNQKILDMTTLKMQPKFL